MPDETTACRIVFKKPDMLVVHIGKGASFQATIFESKDAQRLDVELARVLKSYPDAVLEDCRK